MVTNSVSSAILAAAAGEIALHGAAGLRIAQVAKVADANKRMIYHYFGDRAGLIEAVVAAQCDLLATSQTVSGDVRALAEATQSAHQPTAQVSSDDSVVLRQAARIVLQHILTDARVEASPDSRRLTHSQWQSAIVALFEMALPSWVASLKAEISERSLPTKPRYRARSTTRITPTKLG